MPKSNIASYTQQAKTTEAMIKAFKVSKRKEQVSRSLTRSRHTPLGCQIRHKEKPEVEKLGIPFWNEFFTKIGLYLEIRKKLGIHCKQPSTEKKCVSKYVVFIRKPNLVPKIVCGGSGTLTIGCTFELLLC